MNHAHAKLFCRCGEWHPAFGSRGCAWLARNECDKAIKDFDEAVRLDPNLAFAFANQGFAWLGKRVYDKAMEECLECI